MESCFSLENPEYFFRAVFDEINEAVVLYDIKGNHLVTTNKKVFDLFGYEDNEQLEAHITDCLTTGEPYTSVRFRELMEKALAGEPELVEWRVKNKEGDFFWVEVSLKRAVLAGGDYLLVIMNDITRLKKANEDLLNSEARFRGIAESLPEVVYEIDCRGRLTLCNNAAFDFFGASREDFEKGINVFDYLIPEDKERVRIKMGKVLRGEISGGTEYTMLKKDGTRISVMLHARPIIKNNHPVGIRGFIVDISRLKENEEKLRYLSYHDTLTGLYNRSYFEKRMHELYGTSGRVMFILFDVDGLKIVNDTLGHCTGDKTLIATAEIIDRNFRNQGLVARIGGDEFAVLLTHGDWALAKDQIKKVAEAVEQYNSSLTGVFLPLSLSVGIAWNDGGPINPWDLFKEADNNMYRQKLFHNQSTRSALVQTLLKALEARDFITEGHADRLAQFVSCLGRSLNLPGHKVTELCLLAHFHDIGKVGIPDRILFKKGKFTPQEYAEMQRHSEIGYRIAQSSHDLAPIADWILKHHEWWNGQGYPLGLKGEEIPLECRILAIADAYDAMTNDRPYRKALSSEEAIQELKRGAGSQFDPELVERFVKLISKLKEQ
ncbi:MAG: HD domain-containing phosphohydrolase [Bacillota bacterium]